MHIGPWPIYHGWFNSEEKTHLLHVSKFLRNHKENSLQLFSIGKSEENLLKAVLHIGLWPILQGGLNTELMFTCCV